MSPAAYRKKVRTAGFSPVPDEGKAPAAKKWQKLADASEDEIELWERLYPRAANTGVLTKFAPALDIDIMDPDAAEAVERLARERFEERGDILVRFGQRRARDACGGGDDNSGDGGGDPPRYICGGAP